MLDHKANCLPKKIVYDYVYEFYNEFKLSIGVCLGIGLLILFFDSEEPYIIFLPFVIWLVLGGIISMINFTDNFLEFNKYHRKLKKNFRDLRHMIKYLYFAKYVAIKY